MKSMRKLFVVTSMLIISSTLLIACNKQETEEVKQGDNSQCSFEQLTVSANEQTDTTTDSVDTNEAPSVDTESDVEAIEETDGDINKAIDSEYYDAEASYTTHDSLSDSVLQSYLIEQLNEQFTKYDITVTGCEVKDYGETYEIELDLSNSDYRATVFLADDSTEEKIHYSTVLYDIDNNIVDTIETVIEE